MKKILRQLFAGTVVFVGAQLAFALPVSLLLSWDANDPAEAITAYHVEHTVDLAVWQRLGSTSNIVWSIGPLEPGVHFYRVVAENLWGESAPSRIISTPASLPRGINTLRIARTP